MGAASSAICSFGRKLSRPWKTDVNLPCKTVGQAKSTWNWLWNSKNLKNNDSVKYRFESGDLLSIQQLKRSDAGNYSCSISNGFSVSSISYHLIVLGKFPFQLIHCLGIHQPALELLEFGSVCSQLYWLANKASISSAVVGLFRFEPTRLPLVGPQLNFMSKKKQKRTNQSFEWLNKLNGSGCCSCWWF